MEESKSDLQHVKARILELEAEIKEAKDEAKKAGNNDKKERDYWRSKEAQLQDRLNVLLKKEERLEGASAAAAAPAAVLVEALKTKGWTKRLVPSSESAGYLEDTVGVPLLNRAPQICHVVNLTSPVQTNNRARRVLATHAAPGSGKTRFLRTLVQSTESFLHVPEIGDNDAVQKWANDTLRLHITFNGSTPYDLQSESAHRPEAVLARRLLHAYFDIAWSDVRDLTVSLDDVLVWLAGDLGRVVLCVDEVAATARGKSISQTLMAAQVCLVDKGIDLYALVSTLDSSIGVVPRASNMELHWVSLPVLPLDDLKPYLPDDPKLTAALEESGGHPRCVEYFVEALSANTGDIVRHAVSRIMGSYKSSLGSVMLDGDLSELVVHIVLKRSIAWDIPWPLGSVVSPPPSLLARASDLLLNSRGSEREAVPFTSPILLRVAAELLGGSKHPSDVFVAHTLMKMFGVDPQGVDALAFERFHCRWVSLRNFAYCRFDECVLLRDLFPGCTVSDDVKGVRLRPTRSVAGVETVGQDKSEIAAGDVVLMPANTPGLDALCAWTEVVGETTRPFLELMQMKFFLTKEKVSVNGLRSSVTDAGSVVSRLCEDGSIPNTFKPKQDEGKKNVVRNLVTGVQLPEQASTAHSAFVLVGTFENTNYKEVPHRTVVISREALMSIYGPTFCGIAQMLQVPRK